MMLPLPSLGIVKRPCGTAELPLLVIDPVLVYSTYFGGSDWDAATAVATDSQGNAYITGYTYSTDFPVANGAQHNLRGQADAFLTKIKNDGSAILFSTYWGGHGTGVDYGGGEVPAENWAYAVAVDLRKLRGINLCFCPQR